MGQQFLHKKDGDRALDYFARARSLLLGPPKDSGQFQSHVAVARMYASYDAGESFRIIEPIAPVINEIRAASAVLDGFSGARSYREGELLIRAGGTASSMIDQYGSVLALVATADFDRARVNADRLDALEARLAARLAIVQAILR